MRAPDDTHLPRELRPPVRALVGMVHLLPLPGSPGWSGSMDEVLERAVDDARALFDGGMDAALVENYGDGPFLPDRVPPWTVAALTRALMAVTDVADGRPVGVNVLRNDAAAALGIATATGAGFVRVNVHTGSAWADQGLLEGRAGETLRARRNLGVPVAITADVHVKHAVHPAGARLESSAADAWHRGLADAIIVSGSGTGAPTAVEDLRRVKDAVPDAPLWVGSGVDPDTAAALLAVADGAIVGSALHRDGVPGRGVERERVERFVEAARKGR